ncbi:uncharacterized protein LOC118404831 isoform X2 [Branchiostoma floridae]|uniref:Uncharacterized protein LOC118404831 isoform X2 n=1 Tax=Branchiostoma floridae TaxID=7739 RepID=A0A9J7HII5_BRAFL|nr:uncharacterized protein LOC118404831 isoform X2 [Branchiostoma floridae]
MLHLVWRVHPLTGPCGIIPVHILPVLKAHLLTGPCGTILALSEERSHIWIPQDEGSQFENKYQQGPCGTTLALSEERTHM